MNRITYTTIEKIATRHNGATANLVEAALRDLNTAEETIANGLAFLKDKAAGVQRALDARQHMNSLGEFQSVTRDIDMAIGKREQTFGLLAHVLTGADWADLGVAK